MWKRISLAVVIIALLIGGYVFTNPLRKASCVEGVVEDASHRASHALETSLYPRWDVNSDGIVDIADLAIVSQHFGEVTEPILLVSRVIDGDTIELADGTKIRYIGIDTPEKDTPLWQEATEANRVLVEGKLIRLEYDTQKQDKNCRILAYVYVDYVFINCELLRSGLAEINTYKQSLKYLDSLIECQWEAITNQRGIWKGVSEQDIVYITATGDKYHLDGCRYLKDSAIPTTIEKAIARGYTPCSVCKP